MHPDHPTESPEAGAFDYRRARLEHYLDRAQECLSMRRYLAARTPLESVLSLDPANSQARSLQEKIHDSLSSLSRPFREMAPGEPGRRTGSLLVMTVDQDENLLLRMARGMTRYGFLSVSAGNYREAVELLGRIRPDIIFSEVNFENGPAGFDLYLWVRTNARLEDVPFIFLASRVDREALIAGKRLGVNDFITKPFDEAVVHASIVSVLGRRARLR
ncbi:MAG: response regulator [Bacteroidota bacterium]